ncbi:MAG: UDP-2,3-diacylglucosamine diphosphatase [Pseudomonadota bacterium]
MKNQIRSLFVSDVHLGTPNCKADYLLRLLREKQMDQLYLVGDIVDIQAFGARPYWSRQHTEVVETILALADEGTRVVYVPGNHDAQCRAFVGDHWRGVEIHQEVDYTARDGARFRIRHGDELDELGHGSSWLESVGETLYGFSCRLNTWYNAARQRFSLNYTPWSISVKRRLSKAMAYVQCFEDRALAEARRIAVDGYICGHIHFANVRCEGGVAYMNDGDWVEHCTALCELPEGGFELWHCADRYQKLAELPLNWWMGDTLPTAA